MKSIELLSTGLRLLGIFVLLMAIQTAANQYQYIQQFAIASPEPEPMFAYVGIFEAVLLLVAAIVMIKFPRSLATWLLPESREGDVVLDGSANDIQLTLFCVLGVYILSWAIPDFLNNAIWIWYTATSEDTSFGAVSQFIIQQVVTLVELGIGLFLCVRTDGVNRLIRRLRTAGAK